MKRERDNALTGISFFAWKTYLVRLIFSVKVCVKKLQITFIIYGFPSKTITILQCSLKDNIINYLISYTQFQGSRICDFMIFFIQYLEAAVVQWFKQ